MRKIVPDPPASSLESSIALQDTLVQASEHILCALSVASQSVLLNPVSPTSKIMQAVIHEMATVQALLESAEEHAQMRAHLPVEPRTLH
ncbi:MULTISPECIES: hypothetical protein [unclassified Pseudomonas]|uniref:hypothetical protein n=1 Tax=unclassified Pseudomonas TaxID=196821 RepID=UPI0021BB21FC|nr:MULTISPECIES: hypothetical protein [unclassified Pseudomonas]MCT8166028.1 hypothetical protein [Pseudomonas sp. HD6422]MCT8182031.1 hypothetical protein [Pseudomonas sp. HD6421]